MENCYDFISWLGRDVSSTILKFLEDPADLVRVSAVSRSWRQFGNDIMDHIEIGSNNSKEWENLERDHRVYALLARGLMSFIRRDCISEAISASSTDNYPEESIQNTLEPNDRVDQRASYWSSKGESNPAVSETLTYKLISKLCVITEVSVQPFQAFFQFGFPIYSATAVRFRMGHLNPLETENVHMDRLREDQKPSGDQFVWTYVSPEFPMAQENCLQKFKLPEPVLCIGGILQIELMGRVQRQEMDGLFYICVAHVQVVGRPLSPAFDVDILDLSGKCILKYYPEAKYCMSPARSSECEPSTPAHLRTVRARLMQRGMRGWEQMILNTLLGNVAVFADDDSDEEVID